MATTGDITRNETTYAAKSLRRLLASDGREEEAADVLRDLLEERLPNCESNYLALKHGDPSVSSEMPDADLPEFFVRVLGAEMFYGEHGKKVRDLLLEREFERRPRPLIRTLMPNTDPEEYRDEDALPKFLDKLKRIRWRPGSSSSKEFVRHMGFSPKFAGTPFASRPDRMEAIERRQDLGALEPFQKNLVDQIVNMLDIRSAVGNRGILRLPTGSGKTRIAVEAVLEFWKRRHDTVRFVMWVGQTEELCEQAFQSFRQVWEERGLAGEPLIMHRVWDGRPLPDPHDSGIVVAGISQLYQETSSGDENRLSAIRDHMGALVVDEAHRSITKMYNQVYGSLGITRQKGNRQIPLLGITATPYRADDSETLRVLIRYNNNILHPRPGFEHGDEFDGSWEKYDDIMGHLRDLEVLSNAEYRYYSPDGKFEMTHHETEELEQKHVLPTSVLDKIGRNPYRNMKVYNIIADCAKKYKSILFFGANVGQAMLMKTFLNSNGIKSAAVIGKTNFGNRRKYVQMFKKNQLQVLCNYNVLTTGFDSPNVDAVIIARPTSSRLVYEQMVGRGLRGTKFGGTRNCLIVTVIDNIRNYNDDAIEQGAFEFAKVANMRSEEKKDLDTIRKRHGLRKLEY